MTQAPTFSYEQLYWQQGISLIAGVDEVGMGALAGPVCAGAVIFSAGEFSMTNSQFSINDQLLNDSIVIRDSKTMSAKQREKAVEWIKEHALAWAVAEATVAEISEFNIRGASHLAMRRAIDALHSKPELLLLDGTPAQPHPEVPAVNIIDGDALCFSIAAASIIAKVHRDTIMANLGEEFPAYQLASNKGYGSAAHMTALREFGPCIHHRPTYEPVRLTSESR